MAVTASGGRLVAKDAEGATRELGHPDATLAGLITGGLATAVLGAEVADPTLRSPVQPGKIVAIGLNYLDHVREAHAVVPEHPLVFAKFPSSVVADGEPIRFDPAIAQRVDWEVELAVVIGRSATRVAPEGALDHVFGYLVANDVSARDVQFADGQWIRGKNLDTFCPLGSWVVTADEILDPQSLTLGTKVNGVVKQSSSTEHMVFGVAELISFCSHSFTLDPGDVLLTGTPWGCGEFMEPKESLHQGDLVTVYVEGVDELTNPVEELVDNAPLRRGTR